MDGTGYGGGVGVVSGSAAIVNSTISSNIANTRGGGAHVSGGALSLTQNTIAFNTAIAEGGGIFTTVGVPMINNLVAMNNGVAAGPQVYGPVLTPKNNLISNGAGATGISNGVAGNLVGTAASVIDAKLGSLANNGGASKTHALRGGGRTPRGSRARRSCRSPRRVASGAW